jgi:hypothetical protein
MKYFAFLDNIHVNIAIIIILILYNSQLFVNINETIGNLYKYNFIKLLILLVITYIASKDTNIAILLAVSYVISLNNSSIEKFEDNNYDKIIYNIKEDIELSDTDMNNILESDPIYKNIIFKHLFRKEDKKLDKFDMQIENLINNKLKKTYIGLPDFLVARNIKVDGYKGDINSAQNKFFYNL